MFTCLVSVCVSVSVTMNCLVFTLEQKSAFKLLTFFFFFVCVKALIEQEGLTKRS